MKDIYSIGIQDILPPSLKSDPDVAALAAAIEPELREISLGTRLPILLAMIDQLPEDVVDLLAWQFHVDFYEPNLPLPIKRELVRNSIPWHRYKGTPYVVEQLVSTVFAKSRVEEWWEYSEGEPYHFRIVVGDAPYIRFSNLMWAINTVKNVRSWLDYVIVELERTLKLRTTSRAWLWRYPLCNIEQTISKQGIPLISHLCLPTSNRQTRWDYLLSGEITTLPRKGVPLLSSIDVETKTKRIIFDYSLCNVEKAHTRRGDCIVSRIPIDALTTQSIFNYPLCTMTVATSATQSEANVADLHIKTNTTTAISEYSLCGYFMPEKLAGIGMRSKAEITSIKYSRAFPYKVCNDTVATVNQKGNSEKISIDFQTRALAQNRHYNLSGQTVAISNKGYIVSGVFPFTTKYSKTHIPYKMCGQMTARSDVA